MDNHTVDTVTILINGLVTINVGYPPAHKYYVNMVNILYPHGDTDNHIFLMLVHFGSDPVGDNHHLWLRISEYQLDYNAFLSIVNNTQRS